MYNNGSKLQTCQDPASAITPENDYSTTTTDSYKILSNDWIIALIILPYSTVLGKSNLQFSTVFNTVLLLNATVWSEQVLHCNTMSNITSKKIQQILCFTHSVIIQMVVITLLP